jgi:hypothetical protein
MADPRALLGDLTIGADRDLQQVFQQSAAVVVEPVSSPDHPVSQARGHRTRPFRRLASSAGILLDWRPNHGSLSSFVLVRLEARTRNA